MTGLPLNGRNILDLALLQPGVNQTFNDNIRVNGSRSVENNFQRDGSNNNEVAVGGSTGVQPRPDAVQEFRLLTLISLVLVNLKVSGLEVGHVSPLFVRDGTSTCTRLVEITTTSHRL